MRSSQSKDLKSFFSTLVAHTKPRARSQLGQSTLQPESKLDTSLNAAGTILQLARDTGEAASQVPYVKAVAGVLSQIIKIRDEIQSNKERCDEIIGLIQLKSTTILQSLDSVYLSNGADVFEDLKSDLEAYADFLRAVLRDDLEPFKAQPRWASYVNRGKKASDLQRLERHLDDFKDRFSIKRLVAISVDARNTFSLLSKPLTPLDIIPQALPPSPKFIIGRESVVESIVQVFLSSSEPRASILGPGGMGKSTIATAVLHDSRITLAYPTKYFVSSELAPTTELLKTRIADAFSIPQNERETDLTSRIVDRIRRSAHPVFLYIDNLETVWEVESEQPQVDQFLDVLSGAGSKIALLVTMRGTQEPKTSFPWEATVLHGLDASSSVMMYEGLSGKVVDASAHELLSNLSGSPLAIKLFALMVKEGDKPSQLLSSWNDHGAKTLEIGGKHRLSSLEQSIHLSVFSPRIVDADRLVLGLIALMPDGLSTSSPWFDIFQYVLPNGANLQTILRSLRRAALLEENGEPSRWQMLPPIRQFCLRLVDSTSPPVISLVELYMKVVSEYWDHSSFTSRAVIPPETANIRGLFVYGSRLQPLPPSFGAAVLDYIRWTNWQNIDESGILSSFHDLPIPANDLASLHYCLGVLHRRWHRLSAAEVSFTRAQELYCELQDQFGEASTQTAIGDLHMQRDQLDAADASYTLALDLYEEIENPMGRGNLHQSIGDLHMRRDRLDEAEASFTLALELFTDIQYPHGEASSHKSIGCLLMRRGHFGPAEESFTRARVILDNIEDLSGRADIEESIGHLHMRQNRLDAAEASYHQALKFYSDSQDQLGQANILKTLGDIHMNREHLDAAKVYFTRALELYRSVQDRLGEAMAHKFIGSIHMQRDQLEAAEASFTLALALYGDTQDQHGQALTYEFIGNLHMRRDQLDTAETAYSRALELYIKVQDRLGEANAHKFIGGLHYRRDKLNEAEVSYNRALGLYVELQDRLGQANALRSIGCLHLCRDRLDVAEASLNSAMELCREIKDREGEANTYKFIGELHLQRDQLEAADMSFTGALGIYGEIQDHWGEANTRVLIGDLCLRRDKLDAAEASFTCALDFYAEKQDRWYIASCSFGQGRTCLRRQDWDGAGAALTRALTLLREVNELWGSAAVSQAFGDLYLRSDRLDEAETSLNLALNIFTTQVESRTDEARTNRSFGKLYLRRSQFVDCERVLRRALELDIIAGSRVGQGQSHRELGAMFMKKGEPAAAESSYADALRLFLEIEDYQATSCLFDLGCVWVQQGKMEESDALISELLRVRWDAEEEIRKPKDGVVFSTP